jgi:hypothetical protein
MKLPKEHIEKLSRKVSRQLELEAGRVFPVPEAILHHR